MATFHPGLSGQTHQWKLRTPNGAVLAETVRVHRGGKIRRALWTGWNMANMHIGDDIHVELRGADRVLLAKASSDNATPAVVTVHDADGAQVARSVRTKSEFSVFGVEDLPVGVLECEDEGPWPVTAPDGAVVGELLVGKRDPSRKPGLAEWALFTDVALNARTHEKSQHLGLRRVVRYGYAPVEHAPVSTALALLPLLAGLTY